MRLLVVQHLYAWSYEETVERVADSLVLRWFCRVYFQHVPTKTTLLRWAATIRPTTLQALIDRTTLLAKQAKVTRARKLRVDSTCVQTSIHHPIDSGLLDDGVRVLCRLIRRARPLVQASLASVREAFRSRLRTSRRLVQRIHRVSRLQGGEAEAQRRDLYHHLLKVTRQAVRQAQRVRTALQPLQTPQAGAAMQPSAVRRLTARLAAQFDRFLPLVEQVIHQARRRVLDGQPVPSREKVLSLFEPHTRVVQRGKTKTAVEFGRQARLRRGRGRDRHPLPRARRRRIRGPPGAAGDPASPGRGGPSPIAGHGRPPTACQRPGAGGAATGGASRGDPLDRQSECGPARRRTGPRVAAPLSLACGHPGDAFIAYAGITDSCAAARMGWSAWSARWAGGCWPATCAIWPVRQHSTNSSGSGEQHDAYQQPRQAELQKTDRSLQTEEISGLVHFAPLASPTAADRY